MGQGEGAWGEDVQVYVLMPHSPLPTLTIPPHWLTVPANNCHQPHTPTLPNDAPTLAASGAAVSSTSILCEILVLRSGTCLSQCQ